jgi:hypothetical protein
MLAKLAPSAEADRPGELGRTLERLYRQRYSARDVAQMRAVWRVLVRHFLQARLRPESTVLDVGAGHCLFINEVRAARRIALDANPDVARHAAPGVEAGWRRTSFIAAARPAVSAVRTEPPEPARPPRTPA